MSATTHAISPDAKNNHSPARTNALLELISDQLMLLSLQNPELAKKFGAPEQRAAALVDSINATRYDLGLAGNSR